MATEPAENVLFLCTGNSARSILAEVIMNAEAHGRFAAVSAGSHPVGQVNPGALAELTRRGHDTSGLRSKSWDEYATADGPEIHWVVTVCDNAAGEVCPIWPGSPLRIHWGLPDPAAAEPAQIAAAFERTYDELARRIGSFVSLSERLQGAELARALRGLTG